jgi:hypothetical protein
MDMNRKLAPPTASCACNGVSDERWKNTTSILRRLSIWRLLLFTIFLAPIGALMAAENVQSAAPPQGVIPGKSKRGIMSEKPADVDGKSYDLVVIGATPGGIACAVRAAREGLSVLLVQHNRHIGGMLR